MASAQGLVVVLEAGANFNVLATNKLDGAILATPAIVGPNIYVRTESHLYGLGIEKKTFLCLPFYLRLSKRSCNCEYCSASSSKTLQSPLLMNFSASRARCL